MLRLFTLGKCICPLQNVCCINISMDYRENVNYSGNATIHIQQDALSITFMDLNVVGAQNTSDNDILIDVYFLPVSAEDTNHYTFINTSITYGSVYIQEV